MKYLYGPIRYVTSRRHFVRVAIPGLLLLTGFHYASAQSGTRESAPSCPVSLTVQVGNLAPEFLLASEDSNPDGAHASSIFQGSLYIELTTLTKPIAEATLGITLNSHGPQSETKTKTFRLSAGTLAKSTLLRTLLIGQPSSFTRVEVHSLTYGDGSRWQPAEGAACALDDINAVVPASNTRKPAMFMSPKDPNPTAEPVIHTRAALISLNAWTDYEADLVIPGSSGEPTKIIETPVKSTSYLGSVGLSVIDNPTTASFYIVPGGQGDRFYISDATGLTALMVDAGALALTKSIFTAPVTAQGPEGAVALFLENFSDKQLMEMRDYHLRIGLTHGVPFEFWTKNSSGSSEVGFPTVTGIDISGQLLRLDLLSSGGKYKGTFWIDLNSNKVVKTIIDGKQVM